MHSTYEQSNDCPCASRTIYAVHFAFEVKSGESKTGERCVHCHHFYHHQGCSTTQSQRDEECEEGNMVISKEQRLRSSFACDICRRIKMKCVPLGGIASDPKPPCQRCTRIGHRCTFQGLDQAPPKGKRKRKSRSQAANKVNNDAQLSQNAEAIRHILTSESISQHSTQGENASSSVIDDRIPLLESPLAPSNQSNLNLFDRLPGLNEESLLTVNQDSFSFSPSSAELGDGVSSVHTDPTNIFDINTDRTDSPASITCSIGTTDTMSIPEKMHPLALLAEASLGLDPCLSANSQHSSSKTSVSNTQSRVPSFCPSTSNNRVHTSQPLSFTKITPEQKYWLGNEIPPNEHEIISNNLLNWTEIEHLFQIYFKGYAQHFLILDPSFHTVQMVSQRSSVLLTTICALASRSYPARPTLHKDLFAQVNALISTSISEGIQSVELIQALLLLSMWPLPMSRWEDGKSWMLSGIAFRMATELNLHELGSQDNKLKLHPSLILDPETITKEIRNQERCFLTCFSVDQSFSTMRGKPTIIPYTTLIRDWKHWIENPNCKRWEIGICAFNDLMGMLTEQRKTIQSLQKIRPNSRTTSQLLSGEQTTNINDHPSDGTLLSQIHVFDDKIEDWRERWMKRGLFHHQSALQTSNSLEDHLVSSIVEQMPLRYNYAKLVINSLGLQHCLLTQARSTEIDVLFSRCWRASFNLLNAALKGMRPLVKYLPDTQFLVLCYASVFLLKLRCHPMASLSKTKNADAVLLVTKVAQLLDSITDESNHHPGIYSSFLWSILRRIGSSNYDQEGCESNHPITHDNDQSSKEKDQTDLYSLSDNSDGKEIIDMFLSNLHSSIKDPQPLFVQWPEALSGSDFDFGCGNLMEFKENLLNLQENNVSYEGF